MLNHLTCPIVEGTGSELPGLFGLRSMEQQRAILDTDNRKLIFPGPGEVKIILPPGSVVHPLEKAPSGHLLMVIDDYANLATKSGGLPDQPLELLASTSPADTPAGAAGPTDTPGGAAGTTHNHGRDPKETECHPARGCVARLAQDGAPVSEELNRGAPAYSAERSMECNPVWGCVARLAQDHAPDSTTERSLDM